MSWNARSLMADAKFYNDYSRFDDSLGRYETWEESVHRVMSMHRDFFKDIMTSELKYYLDQTEQAYCDKKVLGAQRALQFGGKQLFSHMARMYNCAASYCDRADFFGEAFYLMLCGTGVGFSVQKHHVAKLPNIIARTKQTKEFIIPDSIEGWAQSVDILLSSFFESDAKYPEFAGRKVYFDYSQIRPKGAFISGGFKAPGAEGLQQALTKIELLLKQEISNGANRLRPIVAYDIVMHIADAVISGGVRRSATICIFSKDDEEMMTAKTGAWFVDNPQRGRSNNSALLLRDEVTLEELQEIMKSVQEVGEPGFILADSTEALFNPCVEIGQYGYTEDGRSGWQMCNLTEINGGLSNTPEAFYEQCKYASILGTLQAAYTDFKVLGEASKEIIEREALIGVSITGWMNNPDVLFDTKVMAYGAEIVKEWNKKIAEIIGINQAARATCVKPSGNASVLLGTASGIHGEHSPLYIRHAQFNKETEIAKFFMDNFPDMVEPSVWNARDIVIGFPIVSPEGSLYKDQLLGIKQLEYVKKAQEVWIEQGTNHSLCVQPWLRHNVSNTITVDDWDKVTQYVYDNRYSFCGISFLSAMGDRAYPQAPFTEVLTHEQIVAKYGEESLFTSALIEAGLQAFNNDLWTACSTALGYGEQLTDDHKDLLKRDWVRRFNKFAKNFMGDGLTEEEFNKHNELTASKNNILETMIRLRSDLNSLYGVLELFDETSDGIKIITTAIDSIECGLEKYEKELAPIEEAIQKTEVQKAINKSKEKCNNCLKDVYILHKWWRIQKAQRDVDFASELKAKEYTDINTMGAQACSGGNCDISF